MKVAHRFRYEHGGWDYRCCGIEAHKIRQMTDEEYRSVKRPALLWLTAFLVSMAFLAIPRPSDPLMNSILGAAKAFDAFFGFFALWLALVFGRCVFHKTVMVFHGKPDVDDQFRLARLPCPCPIKISKEPVTIRVFWPTCTVLVDSELWQPHPWFRRWPHAVKLVAMALGETEFSGSRKMNQRERRELERHVVGAFMKILVTGWMVVFFIGMWPRFLKDLGFLEASARFDVYIVPIFLIAIACQFFWIYRAFLMLLDCLWGRVYRHPGSEFSWLRISRAEWHRDGEPAKWRAYPGLKHYPPSALSRYARENLSYHKRGIGDERPA